MTELLKITELSKSYDGQTYALEDVNLNFDTNEFVVIIGPSGSGKSTLIRCINQLVKPSGGSIIFDGKEMLEMKQKELRKLRTQMGMVFQSYNLIERSNVLQNVLNGKLGQLNQWDTIFGRYSEEDINHANHLLEDLGLGEHILKRADSLSGGQMQRVGIARALMQKPKLLLADEPIASLDPNSSDIVMNELKRVTQEKGISCIVNLHQVEVALDYATRIIGIRHGKVVFDDVPEKLTKDVTSYIYEGKEHEATQVGAGV